MYREELYLNFDPFDKKNIVIVDGDHDLSIIKEIIGDLDDSVRYADKERLINIEEKFSDINFVEKFFKEDVSVYLVNGKEFKAFVDFGDGFSIVNFSNLLCPRLRALPSFHLDKQDQIDAIEKIIERAKGPFLEKAIVLRKAVRTSNY